VSLLFLFGLLPWVRKCGERLTESSKDVWAILPWRRAANGIGGSGWRQDDPAGRAEDIRAFSELKRGCEEFARRHLRTEKKLL
jgi:hypothetical protein